MALEGRLSRRTSLVGSLHGSFVFQGERVGALLGADISVRLYPGTGPRLTDRHQARMVEILLRSLSDDWRPHVEVPVSRPSRGVIDVVLERPAKGKAVLTQHRLT